MPSPTNQGKSTCGACGHWNETKTQCKGMGYCGHPLANQQRVGRDQVIVAARFLPRGHACLIVGQ